MTTPYTYLIKFIPTNSYYYGVRYAKGCSPDDLWSTYFTSSKVIKQLALEYGRNAFIVEVRRVFNNSRDARLWENKVLRRMNVVKRADFLNQSDSNLLSFHNHVWINDGNTSRFIDVVLLEDYRHNGWKRGRLFSDNHRRKNSQSLKGHTPWNRGKKHSDETRQAIREGITRSGPTVMGHNNNAKPITVNGINYSCLKEAQQSLGISRYKLLKLTETHCPP